MRFSKWFLQQTLKLPIKEIYPSSFLIAVFYSLSRRVEQASHVAAYMDP